MGKREKMSSKLDAWLGRGFKTTKLNALLNVTVSRLAVLRNQRRVRSDHARADVAELLRQGHQERALLRAEYLIKEQNMLDAFAMVESYCHVVMERSSLLENHNQKDCPEELREAIAGLLFAGSRCGELPELHEVRSIFASRLGKEFVAAAVELRNNCGVNTRIIQKLSTKQASLESRTKVTKDIAAELGIPLHHEDPSSEIPTPPSSTPKQPVAAAGADDVSRLDQEGYLLESEKIRHKYKNAVSAAQAAFESAAYAAAAARAAVELSRSESQGKAGPGDQSSPRVPARTTSRGRSHPVQSSSSETESEKEMEHSIKPVQHPGEGVKRMEDDASEEEEKEEESEEEVAGGEEFMGNQRWPMQRSAPGSRKGSEHDFLARRVFVVSSDEGASAEEMEETKPQMADIRWRSQARPQVIWERSQHQEPYKEEYRYRKEEEEREGGEEQGPATHGGEKSWGRNAAGRVPVNRLGLGKVPVSLRTRRSGGSS